jgi:hypothetical protein
VHIWMAGTAGTNPQIGTRARIVALIAAEIDDMTDEELLEALALLDRLRPGLQERAERVHPGRGQPGQLGEQLVHEREVRRVRR